MDIEELKKFEVVTVCGDRRDSPFKDNIYDVCGDCGKDVMLRPHSPHGEGVLLLCFSCAMGNISKMQHETDEEIELIVTEKTRDEARELARKALS